MSAPASGKVTIEVGGQRYTLACAPGEEDHVARLGRIVDAKVAQLGGARPQSQASVLLYAALLLADEAGEAGRQQSADTLAEALEQVAERLEALASRLEQPGRRP